MNPEKETAATPTHQSDTPAVAAAPVAEAVSTAPEYTEVPVTDTETKSPIETPAKITSPIFVSKSTNFPEMLFSVGLSSIFFLYAAVGLLHPSTISQAYSSNVAGRAIGHADLAVRATTFINLFLGVLALMGRWRIIVFGFAGGWLLIIAAFKVLNLLG